jgi:hypothetical protein
MRRAVEGLVIVALAFVAGAELSACSSNHQAATTSSTAGSTTTTVPATATTVAPTTTPPTSAPPTSAPTSTSTTESVCEQRAAETYVRVIAAKLVSGGGLNLTGNPTTMVCGGEDDYHFNFSTTVEAVLVTPGATIEVLPLEENMHLQTIPASALAGYLTTDNDTRIFSVTGPLDAATEIQEQFHP